MNGVDRHAEKGLMVKCNAVNSNIYQGTINDIIEKGFGKDYTTGRLRSMFNQFKKGK